MEDFEKRKKEYLDKINSNEKVFNEIKKRIATSCNDVEGRIELITNPKNEKELRAAKAIYVVLEDCLTLTERVDFHEVKEIPFEESKGVKVLINAIGKVMNGDENILVFDSKLAPEELAEQMYQVFVAMLDGDSLIDYIGKELNVDFEKEEEIDKYSEAWLRTIEILKNTKSGDPIIAAVNNCSEEEIDKLEVFRDKFHDLCEKGYKGFNFGERFVGAIMQAIEEASKDEFVKKYK